MDEHICIFQNVTNFILNRKSVLKFVLEKGNVRSR